MSGVPGFEPGMPVSKTGALTTWLYPKNSNKENIKYTGGEI